MYLNKTKIIFIFLIAFFCKGEAQNNSEKAKPSINESAPTYSDTLIYNDLNLKAKSSKQFDSTLFYLDLALKIAVRNIKTSTKDTALNSFFLRKAGRSCVRLGFAYRKTNRLDEAEKSFRKGMDYYSSANDEEGVGDCYFYLGNLNDIRQNKEEALILFKKALYIKEKYNDDFGVAQTLSNLSIIYSENSEFKRAIAVSERALKINEKINNKSGVIHNLNSLALICRLQQQRKEAISFFDRILKMPGVSDEDILTTLINSGVVHQELMNYDQALLNFNRAFEILKTIENKEALAATMHNIGMIYSLKQNLPVALKYYKSALGLYREQKDKFGIATSCNSLGELYFKTGNVEMAKQYWLEGFTNAKESGRLEAQYTIALNLSTVYEKEKNYRDALAMHGYYKSFKDSLINSENKSNSMRSAMKFKYEMMAEEEKIKMDKKISVAMAEAKKERQIVFLSGLLLSLFVVFALYITYILIVTRKQSRLIEERSKETELQKELIALKNKEVVDSIKYAKRIQLSLMPSEKLLAKHIKRIKE